MVVICTGLLYADYKRSVRLENVIALAILVLTLSGKVNSFWFLPFIMQTGINASLAFYISKKYMRESVFPLLFLICMVIYPSSFHATMEMCTFYFVGLMVAKYSLYNRLRNGWKITIAVVALAIYLSIYLNADIEYNWYFHPAHLMIASGNIMQYFGRQIVAFSLITIVTFGCMLVSKSESWFSRIGKQTLAIYPLHAIMIAMIINNGIKQYLPLSEISRPVIVLILLLTAMGIIVALDKYNTTRISFLGKYKLSRYE